MKLYGKERRQRAAFERMNSLTFATFEEWQADLKHRRETKELVKAHAAKSFLGGDIYDQMLNDILDGQWDH